MYLCNQKLIIMRYNLLSLLLLTKSRCGMPWWTNISNNSKSPKLRNRQVRLKVFRVPNRLTGCRSLHSIVKFESTVVRAYSTVTRYIKRARVSFRDLIILWVDYFVSFAVHRSTSWSYNLTTPPTHKQAQEACACLFVSGGVRL